MAMKSADNRQDGEAQGEALNALLSSVPPLVLPPLLAPSAGAFAAATVIGLGFANQMAGAYLGFLKGAVESTRLMAEAMGTPSGASLAPEPVAAVEDVEMPSAKVVPLRPARDVKAGMVERKPAAKSAREKKPAAAPAKKTVVRQAASASVDARSAGLRQLPGVGPKLETMLQARGFHSVEAIAGLTVAQATALDEELGLGGRIARDGWVERARALVKG